MHDGAIPPSRIVRMADTGAPASAPVGIDGSQMISLSQKINSMTAATAARDAVDVEERSGR
jgi:hypothetical protein